LSVLLSTHRAEEAALCDRVAILDRGRVVALDTPAALIQRVAGDVISLEVLDPEYAALEIERQFGLTAQRLQGRSELLIEREHGHELIPRLVEALAPGSIKSLSMHRPTLADVFVKLTGRDLDTEVEAASFAATPARPASSWIDRAGAGGAGADREASAPDEAVSEA
jgi:ABC-2 type transport system ATP-binding protein